MKFKFNLSYFIVFLTLLVIETLIAINLKDGFFRQTFGDFLVVILLYSFFKSFIKDKSFQIALAVFILSYTVEFLQFFNFLEFLHLQNNSLAKIILGSTFHMSDLVAYTIGIITILIFENLQNRGN